MSTSDIRIYYRTREDEAKEGPFTEAEVQQRYHNAWFDTSVQFQIIINNDENTPFVTLEELRGRNGIDRPFSNSNKAEQSRKQMEKRIQRVEQEFAGLLNTSTDSSATFEQRISEIERALEVLKKQKEEEEKKRKAAAKKSERPPWEEAKTQSQRGVNEKEDKKEERPPWESEKKPVSSEANQEVKDGTPPWEREQVASTSKAGAQSNNGKKTESNVKDRPASPIVDVQKIADMKAALNGKVNTWNEVLRGVQAQIPALQSRTANDAWTKEPENKETIRTVFRILYDGRFRMCRPCFFTSTDHKQMISHLVSDFHRENMVMPKNQEFITSQIHAQTNLAREHFPLDVKRWKVEENVAIGKGQRKANALTAQQRNKLRPTDIELGNIADKMDEQMPTILECLADMQKYTEVTEQYFESRGKPIFDKLHTRLAKGIPYCQQCKAAFDSSAEFYLHICSYEHRERSEDHETHAFPIPLAQLIGMHHWKMNDTTN